MSRARDIIIVRLIAAGVLFDRWRERLPRPADIFRTGRHTFQTFRESGPRGVVRAFNAATHELAKERSASPLMIQMVNIVSVFGYRRWIRRFERLSANDLRAIREAGARLGYQPLMSVLMPVYNTDERWLRAAIESVRRQFYTNWELCIADDASPDPKVGQILREYQAKDSRIKVMFRQTNGHISAASNSALELVTGEFVALLDHDDELPRHALLAVVHELNRHPDAEVIYSDEDRIDESGRRYHPYFKPDWNPELFCGQNVVSHLGVYRTELLRRIGGFRLGVEGSQDYDLAWRAIEQCGAEKVRHLPQVLYHWRAIRGSAALGTLEKSYAHDAARQVIEDHFARTGMKATCEPATAAFYHQRIRYALPDPLPHVTIVIPTRDRVDMLSRCVNSVTARSTYRNYDILIVDNGSSERETLAYFDQLRTDPRMSILRVDEPFNFSMLNNRAAAVARGEVLCFLNNDTEVISADWLEELVSLACQQDVGAVGAMLYYPDNTIQHAGVILGMGGVAAHMSWKRPRGATGDHGRTALAQAMSAVTAACLAVRKSVFDEVGGFDEVLAVAYNDIDLCLRISARGYRNIWTPFAELYHHESVSRGTDLTGDRAGFHAESRIMHERWGELLQNDPYFNPNLSLETADFAPASPPRGRRWWEP